MIEKLWKIALGTVAIAAVIALFTTGPQVAQVWSRAANALTAAQQQVLVPEPIELKPAEEIVNKAIPLFGVDLPPGRESPTFIQNVTQLAK